MKDHRPFVTDLGSSDARKQFTVDQNLCLDLICNVCGPGRHNMGSARATFAKRGVSVTGISTNRLGTIDMDGLTRLVLLAHQHQVRVDIHPHGFRSLEITAHKRLERQPGEDLDTMLHHRTIGELIVLAADYTRSPQP